MTLIIALALCLQDEHDLGRLKAAILERNWQAADTISERYVRNTPDSAEGQHLRGHVLNRRERYGEALVPLRRAGELGRADGPYWLDLGMAELHAASADDAVTHLTKAAELLPAPGPAIYLRGHAHLKRKAWRDAVDDFNRAAELEPKLKQACDTFAGQALQELGEAEESKRRLEEARRGPLPDLSKAAELALSGVRLGESKGPWSVNLRLAVEPVKNAIFLGSGLTVPSDLGRKNDWRSIVGLDADLRLPAPDGMELRLADSFTDTHYRELEEFNSELNTLSLDWSMKCRPFVFRAKPEWSYELRDSDSFIATLSLGAGADWYAHPDWWSSLDVRHERYEYFEKVTSQALDRDGFTTRVTLAQSARFGWAVLRIHVAGEHIVTEGKEYDADSVEGGLSASLSLPWEISLVGRLVLRRRVHEDPSVAGFAGPDRHDQSLIARIEISRPIIGPLHAVLGFTAYDNQSNYDEWSYTSRSVLVGVDLRR